MSGFIARHNAARIGDGVSAAGRVNQAEMLVPFPFLTQLALEGRIWGAGHGLEETATDSEASLDEQKPSFILAAPQSGTVILPIWAEMRMHTEGGAAPDAYLSYVGVNTSAAGSGTDLDKIPIGRLTANAVSSAAICRHTVSALTAITSAQTFMLARRANVLDNMTSVEMATTLASIETFERNTLGLEFDFWSKFHGGLVLNAGQAIMFHTATGTTDSAYTVTFIWAEVPSSVYVPL